MITRQDPQRTGGGLFSLRLLAGTPEEMTALQRVLEAAPRYFEIVTGGPPGPAEALSTFTGLPPEKTYDDKRVWGLYDAQHMIGCADVIRGYPNPEKAVIGLLLLDEQWQGRGLGRMFATLVEQAIARWPEIAALRIGVVPANSGALAFWRKMGYVETGEVKLAGPSYAQQVVVLEKPLAR